MAAAPSRRARPRGRGDGARRAVGDRGGERAAARVLIVSGTGSCCFARGADGRTARLGGWGHVLGDRGSGYEIALGALRAVIRASDYDRRWPALGRRILRRLALPAPEDLVVWAPAAGKSDIAALAIDVFEAAAAGDRIAARVIGDAARTLADEGAACAKLVGRRGAPVEFVLGGSVLIRQPGFARRVARLLRHHCPRAVVCALDREGAWGAVELARQTLADATPLRRRVRAPGPATAAAAARG